MNPPLCRRTLPAFLTAILFAIPSLGQTEASPSRGSKSAERAAGVIMKVVKVAPGSPNDTTAKKGGAPRITHRLTINTAVVWRDWARDQASENVTKSTAKEAAEGANSVATKGQPVSKESQVVVDLGPDTKVEARFRSPTDETSKGAKTPAEALADDGPSVKTKPRPHHPDRSPKHADVQPARFTADNLKAGLFVEIDFRNVAAQNLAATVSVIRPVGGPDTTAKQAAPAP